MSNATSLLMGHNTTINPYRSFRFGVTEGALSYTMLMLAKKMLIFAYFNRMLSEFDTNIRPCVNSYASKRINKYENSQGIALVTH